MRDTLRSAFVVGFIIASMFLSTEAKPHSPTEIEAWLLDWGHQVENQGHLNLTLLAEREDFQARHGYYFNPQPVSQPTTRASTPPISTPVGDCIYQFPPHLGQNGCMDRWHGLVSSHFPSSQIPRALCVAWWESGGNPSAHNGSVYGLFQIKDFWAAHFGVSVSALYDPATNVRIAHGVYEVQGWKAWAAVNRGIC